MGLEFGNFPKSLMCVLVPVRNILVLCFLKLNSISVCGSVPVRSGRPLCILSLEILAILGLGAMVWKGEEGWA
jgi:hypothetical protein